MTNATLKVRPAKGIKVRDPHSKLHLAEQGAEVPRTSYWLRRLASGDVIEVTSIKSKPKGSK